jgi:hypothetical protein
MPRHEHPAERKIIDADRAALLAVKCRGQPPRQHDVNADQNKTCGHHLARQIIRDFDIQQVNHDHAGDIKKSQADRADEAVSPLRTNDDAIALAFDVDIAGGFQADGSCSPMADSCLACRRGRKAGKSTRSVFFCFFWK